MSSIAPRANLFHPVVCAHEAWPKIGEVGYYNTQTSLFTLYSLQWCGNHPRDGLILDGAAHPWWDQEFINALGELLGH